MDIKDEDTDDAFSKNIFDIWILSEFVFQHFRPHLPFSSPWHGGHHHGNSKQYLHPWCLRQPCLQKVVSVIHDRHHRSDDAGLVNDDSHASSNNRAEEQLLPEEYLAAPRPPRQTFKRPKCNYSAPTVESDTPLEERSACRWDYVIETDPLRIPQQIRHARCSCSNCQMQRVKAPFYNAGCEEKFATFPVIRCQEAVTSDSSLDRKI
ncbi:hypothetical protein C0Q70_08424 [Pomacea canaliculata]|uniref:Uncharacterized protein n=1 Tax=Pomacea canaliculata TaxID=400727 RepID=A0A2T7PHS7_POMCA|nr:hypothetical protein C0Q70_08424 [Pomacea canaliculata]